MTGPLGNSAAGFNFDALIPETIDEIGAYFKGSGQAPKGQLGRSHGESILCDLTTTPGPPLLLLKVEVGVQRRIQRARGISGYLSIIKALMNKTTTFFLLQTTAGVCESTKTLQKGTIKAHSEIENSVSGILAKQ